MIKAVLISMGLVSSAFAQQPQQPQTQVQPSMTEMRAALQASMAQTNTMRDMHIQCEAKVGLAQEEIAKLKAEIETLKKSKPDAK